MTIGDNIRRMLETDEGLADFLMEHDIDDSIDFCRNYPSCGAAEELQKTERVSMCRQCLINWLKEKKI